MTKKICLAYQCNFPPMGSDGRIERRNGRTQSSASNELGDEPNRLNKTVRVQSHFRHTRIIQRWSSFHKLQLFVYWFVCCLLDYIINTHSYNITKLTLKRCSLVG